jgi:hypothetical protein
MPNEKDFISEEEFDKQISVGQIQPADAPPITNSDAGVSAIVLPEGDLHFDSRSGPIGFLCIASIAYEIS